VSILAITSHGYHHPQHRYSSFLFPLQASLHLRGPVLTHLH
jgi:hypothetical protein